jgi:hypothetical protein
LPPSDWTSFSVMLRLYCGYSFKEESTSKPNGGRRFSNCGIDQPENVRNRRWKASQSLSYAEVAFVTPLMKWCRFQPEPNDCSSNTAFVVVRHTFMLYNVTSIAIESLVKTHDFSPMCSTCFKTTALSSQALADKHRRLV